MAFVNELYKDEDGLPRGITVDRERNMVLARLSAFHPDSPARFTLNVNGEDIRFSAFQRVTNKSDKTFDIKWEISNIYTPEHIRQEDALTLIKESLDAHGFDPIHDERPKHIEMRFYI